MLKIASLLWGLLGCCVPAHVVAQYVLGPFGEDSRGAIPSRENAIYRLVDQQPIFVMDLDSCNLPLGPSPSYLLVSDCLYGANTYLVSGLGERPIYRFIFATYQVVDSALVSKTFFSEHLKAPRGWRIWYGCDFLDRSLVLTLSAYGEYEIISSLGLSTFESADMPVFFRRFKSMSQHPIPRRFREPNAEEFLNQL